MIRQHFLQSWIILLVMLGTIFSYAQPVNNLVNDVVMPTPEAAALGEFIDVPINYVNGTPQISIPLAVVKDGKLEVAVNLSYHGSGIKSTQYASRCGVGWTTTQFMITRMPQGIPDTYSGGYYFYSAGMVYYENTLGRWVSGCNPPDPIAPNYGTLPNIATGNTDGESDVYSFSTPGGYSGKFMIDKNRKVHLVPRQDIDIDITYANSRFNSILIKTPDGVQHHYGNITNSTDNAFDYQTVGSSSSYIVNWHLVQSNSYDEIYKINYTYENESYTYHTPTTCSKEYYYSGVGGSGQSTSVETCNLSTTAASINGKRLKKIYSQTEEVVFTSDINRLDFASAASAKALSKIEVTTGTYCNKFIFSYDYFTDGGSPGTDPLKHKLKLESLQQFSCDDSITIPAYTFDYSGTIQSNGKIYVPGIQSRAIDHWSYANGQTGNPNFNIPQTTLLSCTNNQITLGSANRDVDTSKVKTATLKQINNPTGGYTYYDFESHSAQFYSGNISPTQKFFLSSCGTLSQCCGDSKDSLSNITFTSLELQGAVTFDFELQRTPSVSSCYTSYVTGRFEIYEEGVLVGALEFNLNPGQDNKELEDVLLSEVIQGGSLVAGKNYKFKALSSNGKASIRLYTSQAGLTDEFIGGLRIKQVIHHDGIDNARDYKIKLEYTDLETPTVSSGIVLDKPSYAYSFVGNPPAMGTGGNPVCLQHFADSF